MTVLNPDFNIASGYNNFWLILWGFFILGDSERREKERRIDQERKKLLQHKAPAPAPRPF